MGEEPQTQPEKTPSSHPSRGRRIRFDPSTHRPIRETESAAQALLNAPHFEHERTKDLQYAIQNIPCYHASDDFEYANAVIHPVDGHAMEYRELLRDSQTKGAWAISDANEFDRLAQGKTGRVQGTDTLCFIPITEMPKDRTATYIRFVCNERPQKAERNRTRATIGGNLVQYPGKVTTRTADLQTVKCLFNSVVSTPLARFMTMDVKDILSPTLSMSTSKFFRFRKELKRNEFCYLPSVRQRSC